MEDRANERLLADLLGLAKRATEDCGPEDGFGRGRGATFETGGNPPFTLYDEDLALFEGTVATLLGRPGWAERFSEDHVRDALFALLIGIRADGPGCGADRLARFLAEFAEYSTEQVVYVPLDGIYMSVPSQPLGNVVLKRMEEEGWDEVVARVEAMGRGIAAPDDEETGWSRDHLAKILKGQVCAEYRVVAEPGRAVERAKDEARRAMDVLNYGIPLIYEGWGNQSTVVSLAGELPYSGPEVVALSEEGVTTTYGLSPFKGLQIHPSTIRRLDEVGVFALSEMLATPNPAITGFERALLAAVHWFASARAQTELPNKLLNFTISLEVLLGGQGGPVTAAVAEGAALVVGEGYAERKWVRDEVAGLYGKRSAISHRGKKDVLETDVARLEWIAAHAIARLIARRSEFTTTKHLLEWTERVKLGG